MKRKKLTKPLAALLAVLMVMFMLPMSVFAVDGGAQAVYLDGTNGNDANSGADSANAVKTLEQAIELVADDGIIYICGQVNITTGLTISGVTIRRADGYEGIMFQLMGEENAPIAVTMEDVTIDGNKENVPVSDWMVNVSYDANLTIKDGTVLQNNGYTALRAGYGSGANREPGHIVMEGGLITGNTSPDYAGGIHNQGNLEITGGVISENWGSYGGGICNESGTLTFSGGEIKDNEAYNGAGISVLSGTLTMEGTASITGNISSYSGAGVYIDNGSSTGDTVFEMKGGTISGNTTGNRYVGSGIYGYCLGYGSCNVIIQISGGTIEGEDGDSRLIALYSERNANPTLVYPSLKLSGSPAIRGGIFLWDGAYR